MHEVPHRGKTEEAEGDLPVPGGGGSPAAVSGGEAPRDPRTLAGAIGLPHSGPRPAGHVNRQHDGHGSNNGSAMVVVLADEVAWEGRCW